MTTAPDTDTETATPPLPPPSHLWKRLPPDRRQQAAEAFWRDGQARAEQAETIAAIAHRIKFRTKSVRAMTVEKKAQQVLRLAGVSELVAARLLVSYHVAHQRPMMGAFLDALGIAHEDGLIAAEEVEAPAPERLREAVRTLTASFPAEDVALYLSTLTWQDPDAWGALAELPGTRLPDAEPSEGA
ncbi:MAG: hypothetical protein FJW23_04940 [Acidimicrobiia bacterium]|nr:hypothetical protein [Acidimicrobiia bacterium]